MIKIIYNVENTSDDKPDNFSDWKEAWEAYTGRKMPHDKIGGHVTDVPNQSDAKETKWIAPISFIQNGEDNMTPMQIEESDLAPYWELKKR
jgi:hypothetical protein